MINHKLNNKLIAITFLGLASLGLSGCVVNVGDMNRVGIAANHGRKCRIKTALT